MSAVHNAANEIVLAVLSNPNLTIAALQEDLERGEVWQDLAEEHNLTIAQWSAAMQMAIDSLR